MTGFSTEDGSLFSGRKRSGLVIIDHGDAAFVTAFFEDALGSDVAGDIVGVSIDTKAGGIKLTLEDVLKLFAG